MRVAELAAFMPAALHKCCLLFVAAQVGMVSLAAAGTNSWTSMGPDGGTVYDLGFHPTDSATMYAATSAGFYRSSDAGASWQRSQPTPLSDYFSPWSIVAGVGSPDSVHLASGPGRILRSDDRGATLRYVPPHFSYPDSFRLAGAADGSVIYHVLDGAIYRSLDGASSHELRGTLPEVPDLYISTLQVAPSNPQVLYAAHYFTGVYRSTDAGATWTSVFVPADTHSDGVWTIAIDPRDANRFWMGTDSSVRVTDDAGATWRTVLTGVASDLDVDPRNSQIAYATLLDLRVLRTADGGTTWTELTVPARSRGGGRLQLAVHPADSARLYLFGTTGVFASADTGATWFPIHEGIPATSPGRFSPTTTSSGHIFFPIAEYGLGRLNPGEDGVDIPFSQSLSQAAGSHPPEISAVLALPTTVIAAFENSRIAFSSNLGSTWTRAATPPALRVHSLVATRSGVLSLFAATDQGIYRSDDLGDHWSLSGTGLPEPAQVFPIAVAANQVHLYAGVRTTAGMSVLYRSIDGGQSWSPTSLQKRGIIALAPHPNDAQTLIVGTNEGAFKTTDGGASWQPLELFRGVFDSPIQSIAIDPVNPDIIYIDTPGTVGNAVRSVDAGATFQRLMPDYYDGAGAVSLLVDPDRSHRVVAAVPGGGIREISIEPDLQLTARAPGTAAPSSDVEFTLTATNRGPFEATGVQVEVRLPTGVSVTSATSNDTACAIASNVATCTVGILRFEQQALVRVRTTPTAEGSLAINASVSGAQPDSATGNNAVSASVSITSTPPTNPGRSGGGGSFGVLTAIALLLAGAARTLARRSVCRI